MNYIQQLNSFYDFLQTNSLSPIAICLYSVLLHINNKCHWKKQFTVANLTIQAISGMSRLQVDRYRNELCQKGYIKYTKGTGNKAGAYEIVIFDTQRDTQVNTQSDTQVIHNLNTLNKQNKNKTYKEKINKKEGAICGGNKKDIATITSDGTYKGIDLTGNRANPV